MYQHILIPTDGSALSDMALRQGMALAKSLDAKITVLTVSPHFHPIAVEPVMVTDTLGQFEKHRAEAAARRLAVAREAAKVSGVTCECLHVVHDHPYQAIIDTAANTGCDLVFMASHGRRGVSKIPVLVCR